MVIGRTPPTKPYGATFMARHHDATESAKENYRNTVDDIIDKIIRDD